VDPPAAGAGAPADPAAAVPPSIIPRRSLIAAFGGEPPSEAIDYTRVRPAAVAGDPTEVDALLEALNHEENPWTLLAQVRQHIQEQRIGAADRHRFLHQFLTLIAPLPELVRDGLISTGRPVFEYREPAARQEVERLRRQGAAGAGETRIAAFVETEDLLAEIVSSPLFTPRTRYMVFSRDGSTAFADTVTPPGGPMYVPPQSAMIEKGTILLPDGVDEYGDQLSLYQEIRGFVNRYVQLDSTPFRTLVCWYVFLTWIYDRFDVVPYLRAIGHLGSGKTRLIQTVGALCYRRIQSGGSVTASPIFRLIERYKGTLIVDEADFSDSDMWSEIVKIFNAGYIRDFPVLRSERTDDGFDVGVYDVYGPKILASRARFKDDALESRCFTHAMIPLPALATSVPLVAGQTFRDEARAIRNKLLLWRFRMYRTAQLDGRRHILGLEPRLNQIVLPLLAVTQSPSMENQLVTQALRYQYELRETRRESFDGVVASALVKKARGVRGARFEIKAIVEIILQEQGDHFKVTSRQVSSCLRDTFKIRTFPSGGKTWTQPTPWEIESLETRYQLYAEPETPPAQTAAPSPTPTTTQMVDTAV
jgi:hypothetical protein